MPISEESPSPAILERCGNCGRAIGRTETHCVMDDVVVCAECHASLKRADAGIPHGGDSRASARVGVLLMSTCAIVVAALIASVSYRIGYRAVSPSAPARQPAQAAVRPTVNAATDEQAAALQAQVAEIQRQTAVVEALKPKLEQLALAKSATEFVQTLKREHLAERLDLEVGSVSFDPAVWKAFALKEGLRRNVLLMIWTECWGVQRRVPRLSASDSRSGSIIGIVDQAGNVEIVP